jgi:(1->4)-alpha-D-glucan 1-alpha-D-glucosylmutase
MIAAPRATARLQLHKDFTFDDAARVVPYYAALGISHIYASPILTARQGSTHGYDIVDPTHINPELGGEEGLRRMVAHIREADMGLILDIVPNHMGVGPENPWWQHVLEWGQDSPYARWFDIDWSPSDETLHGKVMAPFLGKPYGDALSSGEIALQFDDTRGRFFVSYYSHRFPIEPGSYADVLRAAGSDRLTPIIDAFEKDRTDEVAITQLSADIGFGMLREMGQTPEGRADIETALEEFSVTTPHGMDALHALLERQHYRLAWWRCAADGINWRRFFEVTDLAGVRVEQNEVFEATHAMIFRLYTEGLIDGVRIDHVDGLADPGAYCRKLRQRFQALTIQRPPELPHVPAYIIVEKILAADERLRTDWGLDGTTGYEFMDQVGGRIVQQAGAEPLAAMWNDLTGETGDFQKEVRQARRQLLANNLSGEFEAAARALHAVARTDLRTRDYSLGAIRRVFAELLVVFPVYRTYADSNGRDELDQQLIDRALDEARQNVDRTEGALLDVVARWLGGDAPRDAASPRVRNLHQRAITRFQQLTPPLAAKSVEDTAFYRYGRLLSRNEVGSDPGRFSLSVQEFHAACADRAEHFPNSMLTTATHDHKRGEDVRMRIAALSELPDEWEQAVRGWMEMNTPLRSKITEEDGTPACDAPQPADEIMLYQMLLGAWPIGLGATDKDGVGQFVERLEKWQIKALREAKQVSDWVMPNEEYENGCRRFLHAVLDVRPDNQFLHELAGWVERLAPTGVVNSLTQTVLRLTTPGVPDLYQGTEFWDLSLVDPDNRRPVDFSMRVQALSDAAPYLTDLSGWQGGQVKQHIIHRALALRAQQPDLFARGEYLPLTLEGTQAAHAIAFMRRHQDRMVIVVATLFSHRLLAGDGTPAIPGDRWHDTAVVLPRALQSGWVDVYTGRHIDIQDGRLRLSDALSVLPVAILAEPAEADRIG